MGLTESQCKYLQLLGHELQPVVDIGADGLTNSVLKTLDRALADRELVKVRIRFGGRERRNALLAELAPASEAVLVERSGQTALLYRPAPQPIIHLP